MELVMGVGPMNLVITNDALYQLSYTSEFATYVLYIKGKHNASLFLKYIDFGDDSCPLALYKHKCGRRILLLPLFFL